MIGFSIEGHSYKHDSFELIRSFFPGRELEEARDFSDFSYFVESSFHEVEKKDFALARLYRDGHLIKEIKEDISSISIRDFNRDKLIKMAVKKSLFFLLKDLDESNLDWGILTGIRPVKLAHELLDSKYSKEQVIEIFVQQYCLAKTKAELLTEIALLQRKYIYPLDDKRYSLYLAIPFCPSRCSYCSFPAYRIDKKLDYVETYVDRLIYEVRASKEMMADKKLNSVYIGGGTPTSIGSRQLERLIATIRDLYGSDINEFTVEAGRPDTIDSELLSMLKDYAVDRISINPQTMNDRTLKLIGRNHSAQAIIDTYNLAKKFNFDIINMDLIIGLPNEDLEDFRHTLDKIRMMDPENLTIHSLSLKRGSRMDKQGYEYFKESPDFLNLISKEIEKFTYEMDLIPYYLYRQKQIVGNLENVGYSKKGKESIYNIAMMEEKETVIATGLGAVSKIFFPEENRIERVPNYKDLDLYIKDTDKLLERKTRLLCKNK